MTLCECGCGIEAKPGNRFIHGHENRGDNNPAKRADVRKKISDANKGRIVSDDTRKKISQARKGKNMGDANSSKRPDVRKKISESKLGKKRPDMVGDNNPMNQPGIADKVSKAMIGVPKTDDHKKNLSKSTKKTYVDNPEIRDRISESVIKWRKDNPELVDKINIARKEWIENNLDKVKMYTRMGGIASQIVQQGKSSSIEIRMRKILLDNGYDFEVNKSVLGICIPDIIFEKEKIIIQCDGDYWHNYPYGNDIDYEQDKKLRSEGYQVIRFWENEINKNINECFDKFKWFTFGKFASEE